MAMQDPIADMLTRIRNGLASCKENVKVPFSTHKEDIAKFLLLEGYIRSFDVLYKEISSKKCLNIHLKYYEGKPVIEVLKRISKPGLRIYKPFNDLPKVLGGYGNALISTSKGLMNDKKARANKLGGEVICHVS